MNEGVFSAFIRVTITRVTFQKSAFFSHTWANHLKRLIALLFPDSLIRGVFSWQLANRQKSCIFSSLFIHATCLDRDLTIWLHFQISYSRLRNKINVTLVLYWMFGTISYVAKRRNESIIFYKGRTAIYELGMCRCEGYGVQAVYSSIGYINQSVWV